MKKEMCRIPVSASYVVEDGKAVMIDAEYADIPAMEIAEYIVHYFRLHGHRITNEMEERKKAK